MILQKISLFVFLLAVLSCQNEKTNLLPSNMKVKLEKVCNLNSNIEQIGEIQSFDFINEKEFIISIKESNDIFIYDFNGNQIKKINNSGNGPNEYGDASIIRVFDQKIYVWDSTKLNVFVYDLNGNSIKEINKLGSAIKDFIPTKTHIIYYLAGGYENLIASYDILNDSYKYLGNTSEEHILLNMNSHSGASLFLMIQ
ncbi:6-bladed beta-propeller [Polaribacter batillariae]|uniref:6-bladed beta-propeller n=1 Tax=Polaribacter batillariae TaxID=2808900 RepID=A0ABX7SWH7_9FLAO|nr:6-bladed beta-propeller [Polaribacter batillariae]QTD38546.1 6-bladed beta-propeller [Polaribacter batillariae]